MWMMKPKKNQMPRCVNIRREVFAQCASSFAFMLVELAMDCKSSLKAPVSKMRRD